MIIEGTNHARLQHSTSKRVWEHDPKQIVSLVSDHGIIVSRKTDAALRVLKAAKFNVMDVGKQVLVAVRSPQTTSLQGRKVLIVVCCICVCGSILFH
jgi:hypothetical protein